MLQQRFLSISAFNWQVGKQKFHVFVSVVHCANRVGNINVIYHTNYNKCDAIITGIHMHTTKGSLVCKYYVTYINDTYRTAPLSCWWSSVGIRKYFIPSAPNVLPDVYPSCCIDIIIVIAVVDHSVVLLSLMNTRQTVHIDLALNIARHFMLCFTLISMTNVNSQVLARTSPHNI